MTNTQLAHKATALALAVTSLAPLWVTACGPNLAERIAEQPKTYREAVDNGECKRDGVAGNPLIVDWPPEQRGDLEVAMKEGVPVVRYTCERFELLRDCRIKGSYEYLGMTRKEQLVRILSQDELRANLPFSNFGLPASLKGDLDRDASLDIALIMIGKKSTSLTSATASQLEGNCANATHFVRRATLGAFAMDVGTKAHAAEIASLFGFEQKGDSKFQKRLYNKDGDLDACKKSASGAEAAPEQCGALLRLELSAVKKGDEAESTTHEGPEKQTVSDACPKGMHRVNDKCTVKGASCEGASCDAQCDAGSAEACIVGGDRFLPDVNGVERVSRLAKACKLGYDEGCLLLAWVFPEKASEDAKQVYLELIAARCDAGTTQACADAGDLLWTGKRVPKNRPRGLAMLERACLGGSATSCLTVAIDAQVGAPARAVRYLTFACTSRPTTLDEADACLKLGHLYEKGTDVAKDVHRASELYARACHVAPGVLDGFMIRTEGRTNEPHKKACVKAKELGP